MSARSLTLRGGISAAAAWFYLSVLLCGAVSVDVVHPTSLRAQTITFTQTPPNPFSGYSAPATVHIVGSYGQNEECDPYEEPYRGVGACWLGPMYGAAFDTATFKLTNNGTSYRSAFAITYTETCQAQGTYGTGYWCTQVADASGSVSVYPGLLNTMQSKISDSYYSWTQTATYQFNVLLSYKVSVTPKDPTVIVVDSGNTSFYPAVKNIGNQTANYALTPLCSGVASGCTIIGTSAVTIVPPNQQTVQVNFNALTRGATGSVRLVARYDAANADTGLYNIKVRDKHYVTVTPVAGSINAVPGGQYEASFNVRYVDSVSQRLLINAYCSGSANYGSCFASADTISPASGVTTLVRVTFSENKIVGDSGVVQLNAAMDVHWPDASVIAIGKATTRTISPPSLAVVTLDSTNTGDVVERDLCLTINLGPNAASECGDLRLVHALSSVRTMNKSRTPTLIYNSQHAHPAPVVAALVTPPTGQALPTTVEMRVLVNGAPRTLSGGTGTNATIVSWPGSQWSTAGQSRRIATVFDASDLATGVYAASVEVTLVASGGTRTPYTVVFSLPVVNRKASPLGAGWWLAGVETFYPATKVWVGGDGSVRKYQATTIANRWAATAVDRPDTIALVGTTYVRYLPDSLKVYFDATTGRHVQTRNRLGHVTTFHYNANGWLDTLTVPTPGNGGGARDPNDSSVYTGPAAVRRYGIGYYGPSTTQLDSVRVDGPGVTGPGSYRRTVLRFASNLDLLRIEDPDSTAVMFQYVPYSGEHRITGRADRRLTPNVFVYDAGVRIMRVERGAGVDTTRIRITAAETRGVAGTAFPAAHALASYVTKLDGARTSSDVADTTSILLNRFGAPLQSTDALGAITAFEYGDARWTAAVTRVQYANGHVVGAVYDAAGRLVATTDKTRGAVTRFAWDSLTDNVKQTRSPLGATTTYSYTPTTGNRDWQQVGSNAATQVTFQYYTNGLYKSSTPPGRPADRVIYDNLGNPAETRTPKGFRGLVKNDSLGRPLTDSIQIDTLGTLWAKDTTVYNLAGLVSRQVKFGPNMSSTVSQLIIVQNYFNADGQADSVIRSVLPDPAQIGRLKLSWKYDTLGRTRKEIATDGAVDSTWYDPAGNAVGTKTRRGHLLTMQYDAVGRLLMRRADSAVYATRRQGIPPHFTPVGLAEYPSYPGYPNDGTGYKVPVDSAVYRYDPMGNMILADNRNAQVRRTYDVAGFLTLDTLRIRAVAGGSMTKHQYGLRYQYDLDGHRTHIWHPSQLAPSAGSVAINTYDPATGMLASVADVMGNLFRFHFNTRLELDSVYTPGGGVESYVVDADGNLIQHNFGDPSTWVRKATMAYDAGGRMLRSMNSGLTKDTINASYSGLGYLRSSVQYARATSQGIPYRTTSSGSFEYDPLGNLTRKNESVTDSNTQNSSAYTRRTYRDMYYQQATARQVIGLRIVNIDGQVMDTLLYDAAGNVEFSTQHYTQYGMNNLVDRASYYGADNKVYAADYRTYSSYYTATFEEYRYDALGRRVWTRARRNCEKNGVYPADCKVSLVRRTVWDGSNELYEIQRPTDSLTTPADTVESDTKSDTLAQASDVVFDLNRSYGRVAYSYGVSLDQPLSVVRMNYADYPTGKPWGKYPDFTILPAWDSRGRFYAVNPLPCYGGDATRCVWIVVPGYYQVYGQSYSDEVFHGTLLTEKADKAGTFYRRNRLYDPATGRFTQEDPIGLAGGLNAYGFANGNPISFSDPFGLCPYGQAVRDYNTADCANDRTGNALRALDKYAGELGKETIRAIADNKLDPFIMSPASVKAACGSRFGACIVNKKIIYLSASSSVGTIAADLVHETTHSRAGFIQSNELQAWHRAIQAWRTLPRGLQGTYYRTYSDWYQSDPAAFDAAISRALQAYMAQHP